MKKYLTEYLILRPEELLSRDNIKHIPEGTLSPLLRAELNTVRRGTTTYKIVCADTPENRDAVTQRVKDIQIAAYREGWMFDPEKYQVRFVDPADPVLKGETKHVRAYRMESQLEPHEQRTDFAFAVEGKTARRMDDQEVSDVVEKVEELFRD